jgi:ferredoxin, 2Fe-2S
MFYPSNECSIFRTLTLPQRKAASKIFNYLHLKTRPNELLSNGLLMTDLAAIAPSAATSETEPFDADLAEGEFTAIDREGQAHRLPGMNGFRLMEIMRDFGLDIAATCGGAAACGTCHVYVDPMYLAKLPKPGDDEEWQLDHVRALQPNSRLSCQILWDEAVLDGLTVTLGPKE